MNAYLISFKLHKDLKIDLLLYHVFTATVRYMRSLLFTSKCFPHAYVSYFLSSMYQFFYSVCNTIIYSISFELQIHLYIYLLFLTLSSYQRCIPPICFMRLLLFITKNIQFFFVYLICFLLFSLIT